MEKLKIVEKAWSIDWDKIDEGAYYSGNIEVLYAETRSKARGRFFAITDICDYKLSNGDDIEFINIPFARCKAADKYDFNGEILTKWEYEEKQNEIERQKKLDEILNNKDITHCYIEKGSYYSDNWCGYTSAITRAGVYLKSEAVSHARSVCEISIIPINKIKHNEMINLKIKNLQKKLIN
jgi:hypothetical protein